MDEIVSETALVPAQADLQVVLHGAVSLWASVTTSESERRANLSTGQAADRPLLLQAHRQAPVGGRARGRTGLAARLAVKGISAGTCYQHACLLSSFYSWATRDQAVGRHVRCNVNLLAGTFQQQVGKVSIRNRTLFGDCDRFYQNYAPRAMNAAQTLVRLTAYNNATRRKNLFNQTDVT